MEKIQIVKKKLGWGGIIEGFADFGLSLDKEKVIREKLEWASHEGILPLFPLFEFYVSLAFYFKFPVYLLIFNNGDVEPITQFEYITTTENTQLNDHFTLSINNILQYLYPEMDLESKFEKYVEQLSIEEFELIYLVRTGDYESIKVKTKDGKIKKIETTKTKDVEKQIGEILRESNYQKIEIERQDGKIVSIKQMKRKKF